MTEDSGVRNNSAWFFVDRHVEEGHGDRPALACGDERLTYADVAEQVRRVAAVLAADGVTYERRVVLVMPDTPLLVSSIWAAIRLGGVAVPLSTRLNAKEYVQIVADCRPAVVVLASTHRDLAAELAALPVPPKVWIADDELSSAAEAAAPVDGPPAAVSIDDMALMQYTSGSTGTPKGVVHLHRGLLALPDTFARRLALTPDDVCFSAAKLSFGYGFGNSVLFPFAAGASTVLLPIAPDPLIVVDLVHAARPTVFCAVPTLYAGLLALPPREPDADFSSVRCFVSAGEHLPAGVWEQWKGRFGGEILDGLGSTECLHIFISAEPGRAQPGVTGTVVDGFEAKLLDDDGGPVPVGEPGHLWVKSECNGARYWNRHDKTRETMVGAWTRTGDLLVLDEDGQFHFLGRSDDVLKVGGLKVAPTEIEGCLLKHEAVAECAVVGRTRDDGLVEVVAHVVLRDGYAPGSAMARALKAHARQTLAAHKVPRVVEFADSLPRTSTGKLTRYRLRQAAETA